MGGNESLLGATIPEHFASVVEKFPDREAVVCIRQKRRLSYSELSIEIDRLARGLVGMGYGKGDRIGVWSTNNIEWLLIQMATARIGAILVNINPAYRTKELAYALRRSEVQGLFLIPSFKTSDYVDMLLKLIPELDKPMQGDANFMEFPTMRHVILYDPARPEETQRPHPGITLWQEVLEEGESITAEQLDEITATLDRDEAINIQYTSGTTGFPKVVVLSHHNILNNAWFSAKALHFTENDRLCVPVPFYHCFGMVLANLLCLSVGACIIIPSEYFEALPILNAVETGIMAGAPCPPPLMKRVMEDLHCREILIGYGQTEASPITHLTHREDGLKRRTETVGINLPHQEVKVIAVDTGETLPLGGSGEICFRGYHIMKGYYGDKEATNKAIDDKGWLHSGDLGAMDADGYLRITGRLKEMIIRGGENIYPREIEDFLFTHPKVAEVAVFGIPNDFYGEVVMAWIKLHEGETAAEEEIKEFCKGKITHFKVPKHICFVDEFPMTVTGKLQKFRMREITLKKMKG
jgi:fatty-acyl-CoA synthase